MPDVEIGKASAEDGVKDIYHTLSVEEVFTDLHTSKDGLSTAEANIRLEQYGKNALTEKQQRTIWRKIWEQINNVLVGILIVVAVVSAVKAITTTDTEDMVTSWIEVGLIIFVIVLNAWIGIMQEGSAEKAANALKAMLSSDAEVIRNGANCQVPATDVVPGDLVVIKLGDRLPADVRMIEVSNMACQEAALTGESLPIEKMTEKIETNNPDSIPLGDRKNMCFSATLCSQGRGLGVVCATGDNTQIGTINALVNNVEKKKTRVLEQIDQVSKVIAVFVIITAIVTFLVAYFVTKLDALKSVSIALVCAVAMIPEGLASIVSLTYAWAVSHMADINAIVRVLPAVETLGSVTCICSDKTGTLTKNEMSLTAVITSTGRYKVDNEYEVRSHSNFVRDDAFMSTRSKFMQNKAAPGGPPRQQTGDGMFSFLKKKAGGDSSTPLVSTDDDSFPVGQGESPDVDFFRGFFAGGILCSDSTLGKDGGREGEIGNPTELAILHGAYFAGIDLDNFKRNSPQYAALPFSSEYKFMATVNTPQVDVDGPGLEDKLVVHVKGAPDRMIPMCSHQAHGGLVTDLQPINEEYWTEQVGILSSYGLRVLALCRGVVPKSSVGEGANLDPSFVKGDKGEWLTMVGLCAIMDPPRPECVDAIKTAHRAGVRVAMITGDHKDTALAIGDMLGLVDDTFSEALTGPELDVMDDIQLRAAVMRVNVFARASPQNKIQIVEALQAEGQVCSMTGDGVNDAPALKRADMGVAMGKEGTDVAREASEMILADDNFATIVAAVRQGRVVWDNLRKVLAVNTPINNAQGMSVLFGLIFGLKEPVLNTIQVLYCNLICAVTLGFVLAVEPAEDGIMDISPRDPNKRLIGRFLWLRIIIGTIVLVAGTVGSVFWNIALGGYTKNQMHSQALNTLTFSAISITLSARFAYSSGISLRLFRGNKYCWYSIFLLTALQMGITYIPGLNTMLFRMEGMDGYQWGIVVVFMVATFLVMETEKAIRCRFKAKGVDTDDHGEFDSMAASAKVDELLDVPELMTSVRSEDLEQLKKHEHKPLRSGSKKN